MILDLILLECYTVGHLKKIKMTGVLLTGTMLFLATWLYMTIYIRTLNVLELKVIMGILGFLQMYVIVANFAFVKGLVKPSQLATAMGINNATIWIFGAGLFQQIWAVIINTISKGETPYPIEAFQTAFWVQVIVLLIGAICAVVLVKIHNDPQVEAA